MGRGGSEADFENRPGIKSFPSPSSFESGAPPQGAEYTLRIIGRVIFLRFFACALRKSFPAHVWRISYIDGFFNVIVQNARICRAFLVKESCAQ